MKIVKGKGKHLNESAKILTEAYFDSFKEAKNHFKKKINSKEFYVAIDKDEVVGLFSYRRDYSHYANYLSNIVVAKKHRRKGIAKRLLDKYIKITKKEQSKKQKYALSSTDVTNKISINLHLNYGFKELGRIKGLHYGKDEIFFGYKIK